MNETTMTREDFSVRCRRVLSMARTMFANGPDWVTFFREILGITGKARQYFSADGEFVQFERTSEFQEIQEMLNTLHSRRIPGSHAVQEPTRVITVRLPESVHEALKQEASDHHTSMNKLCISKLLQVLNDDVANDKGPANTGSGNRMGMYPATPSPAPSFRSTFGAAQT